jgi:triosephosphate isomerase
MHPLWIRNTYTPKAVCHEKWRLWGLTTFFLFDIDTKTPMFIINCKNYEEISGEKIIILVKVAKRISKKYKIKIAVAPPHHLLAQVTGFSIPILAQHVDNAKVGSTTGFVIPEIIKKSNVKGSLINHSEHRIASKDIQELILRLKKLKMISVVCVKNVAEASKYSKFNPDYIAIEPPELIGSGKAISKEKPELVTGAASVVKNAKTQTKLLCGAGIISGEDVKKAIDLGSKGILVASGIVKAKNWDKIIEEFAKAMV